MSLFLSLSLSLLYCSVQVMLPLRLARGWKVLSHQTGIYINTHAHTIFRLPVFHVGSSLFHWLYLVVGRNNNNDNSYLYSTFKNTILQSA